MPDEEMGAAERKLKVLVDTSHGEEHVLHDKLIDILTELCQVTTLKKKPLDLKTLNENDVFMLISPSKSWDESEIETVRRYVESDGGILVAITRDGRKPERLNKLLEPYRLSVIPGTVGEEYLYWYDLQGSPLLESIKSLAAGRPWGYGSGRIAASDEAEVVIQFKDATLAAKRSLGKGTAYLFSCLPIFGNKQLDKADNRRFLNNLVESLAAPEMTSLQFIAHDKNVLKVLVDTSHGEEHGFYDKLINILTELCRVTIPEKKVLDSKLLTENDVFMLISPGKSWEESEIETVRRYVESDGGILVAMTRDGRKPERLNKLLEPYRLSVIPGTVGEEYLHRYSIQGSQLLEGIKSLAAGRAWGYGSGRIAASDEAEVVMQFKDATLAAKRSLGKGTAYLFSCLPIFGNKQLDQIDADNRRFLNNLVESLATPEMTGTLQFITSDKALAAREIVGRIEVGGSTFLFFTADRVIVAKLRGTSSLAMLGGAALGGVFGAGITDAIARKRQRARLRSLSPDEILRENKENFAIPYERIVRFELCRGGKRWTFRGLRINTASTKYEFPSSAGDEFEKHIDSFADLLLPLLSDKLSIED